MAAEAAQRIIVNVRLVPSLFNVSGAIYLYNEYRKLPNLEEKIIHTNNTSSLVIDRDVFGFFNRTHRYVMPKDEFEKNKKEFLRWAEYDLRHPFFRHIMRPVFYMEKVPYPQTSRPNGSTIFGS